MLRLGKILGAGVRAIQDNDGMACRPLHPNKNLYV
jgi:hypothetical protein